MRSDYVFDGVPISHEERSLEAISVQTYVPKTPSLTEFAEQECATPSPVEQHLRTLGIYDEVVSYLRGGGSPSIAMRYIKKYHTYPWESESPLVKLRQKLREES